MRRDIYIIDPLPNVAKGVKRVLEGLSDDHLQIQYQGQLNRYQELQQLLEEVVARKKTIGLVMPVNDLKERPVLDSYRQAVNNPAATIFDLLQEVRKTMAKKAPGTSIPVVMPFLFEVKVDIIRTELKKRPEIKNTMACLVKYITGIDKTFDRKQIRNAFYQWFKNPEEDNYMMVDYLSKRQ